MKTFHALFLLVLISGCTALSGKCGIESCHGLDITCGPDIPEMCTELYKLGDFCREYADCAVINNACQLNASEKFYACKSCIENCEELYDGPEAFDCESSCRERMDKYCEEDSDCACGRRIDTNECFYGSKELVNIEQQCPDYCSGIAGNFVLKCTDNQCTQVNVLI